MSKAAESLQRRFGPEPQREPGRPRRGGPGGAAPPAGAFPRETSPDDGRTRARDAGHMEIDRIVPDPDQPRKEFSDDAIDRLAASLLKHGQLMPIRVRWNADDRQVGGHLRRAPLPGGDSGPASRRWPASSPTTA